MIRILSPFKLFEDYEHLLDFVPVKRPFILRAIKKHFIQEAIELARVHII
jgi:hypothetical protein